MTKLAIKAENLSKIYHKGIGLGNGKKWWPWRGRDLSHQQPFYALEDVSFEINKGETVGIIGGNGAGKSTLLRILSRITYPSSGRAWTDGRVSSLLEVGTGFHHELTGRENVYLNGTLLGMSAPEVKKRMDEIIAFSGIESFIDTQVKHYSSGMFVRLAFSVSAHLNTDILILDEVLSVGDAGFQQKSLEKVAEVVREGKTVLFASHSMSAVRNLCQKSILLHQGKLMAFGDSPHTINQYLDLISSTRDYRFSGPWKENIALNGIDVNGHDIKINQAVSPLDTLAIDLHFTHSLTEPFRVTLSFFCDGYRCFTLHDTGLEATKSGSFTSTFVIPAETLRPGRWVIAVGGHNAVMNNWFWNEQADLLEVMEHYSPSFEKINLGLINIQAQSQRKVH